MASVLVVFTSHVFLCTGVKLECPAAQAGHSSSRIAVAVAGVGYLTAAQGFGELSYREVVPPTVTDT
jgi:hypothetical protein